MTASSGGTPAPSDQPPTDGAVLLGSDAEEAMEEAGRRMGLICSGCGGFLDHQGWEYLTLRSEMREGVPKIIISKAFICSSDQCQHVRARLEHSATARRPWAGWHIFNPGEAPAESDDQAGPDAEQNTFWNGEPCMAERCTVVVADEPTFPEYWARGLVGTERKVVMVKYGDETFYLDNEGYELNDEQLALLKSRGVDGERQVGYPGWGWDKVTKYRGSPQVGHANLSVQRIVSTDHDQAV